MNHNLLNIVKRIISEKGESVLADPQRLKPLFSDYAKDEPKEERIAFGRCLEMGAYGELKNIRTADERRRKKAVLADQLHAKTGIVKNQCENALGLLEAVIFQSTPSTMPSNVETRKAKPISKRTIVFGIAGAVGAGIGSVIGGYAASGMKGVLHWVLWIAMIAIGICVGLLIAQNIYLKKELMLKSLTKSAFRGIAISVVAGFVAGLIVIAMPGDISRLIAWAITGLGIGLAVATSIPNYPKKRAIIAGLLGGVIGYVVLIAINPLIAGRAGVVIGDIVLGLFVGLSVSIIEEALRSAWLTVIWGPKETRTIALGAKPIVFGSSPEADIHLPKSKEPPVRATVQIENSRIVMHDKKTGQSKALQNGERVDFGTLSFVVNTKK